MSTIVRPRTRTRARKTLNPVAWLMDADRRWRDSRNLAQMSDHMLRDINLTRDEANRLSRKW